jgi:hypothetical protein
VWHGWLILCLLQDDFTFIKRETRDESRRASIEAMGAAVKQQPWKYLRSDKLPPPEQIDPAKFKDASFVRDDTGDQDFGGLGGPAYLLRVLEAERDTVITAEIRNGGPLEVWINGEAVYESSDGIKHSVRLPLKRGANRLLLKVAPKQQRGWPFFYRVLPLSPKLLQELEAKLDEEFPSTVENNYTRIETLPIPKGIVLEVGGLAFTPDGTLMICTRRGEIWSLKDGRWKRFASGLHEPLGICALGNGDVVVAQRPELTRVRDTDGDGEANVFETISDAWGISGNYHEFAFGPARDKDGNLYGTLNVGWESSGVSKVPYRGWAYKVTPRGEFIPIASGLRSPCGLGVSPDGEMFVTDNQGDWVGTSPLFHIKPGKFYGHPASLKWEADYSGPKDPKQIPLDQLDARRMRPAASFVHGPLGHSPGEPVWIPSGPFKGQILVGDQTRSLVTRIALEKIDGEYQGAIFPFREGFASGIVRGAFAPDGSLYLGQTDRGWGSVGGQPFALQRLVFTGKVPMEIQKMSLTPKGFDLIFTKPVDPKCKPAFTLQHYHYKYHAVYGSPQIDPTPVKALSVEIHDNRVRLILPELVPGKIYELHLRGVVSADGDHVLHPAAYYTLNRLKGDEY